MDSDMNKAKLMTELEDKHATLTALLAKMDERQMLQEDVYDGLSLKDVLAHITAWEVRMLDWLQTSLRGDTPVRYAPDYEMEEDGSEETNTQIMNDFNAHIYQANKDMPLPEVIEDLHATHAKTMEAIRSADDRDLLDADRFAWRKGRPFWYAVMGCGYGHYQEHIELIEAWLQRGKIA